MGATVNVMLVVTLILLGFTIFKAFKEREIVLPILAMITMALFTVSQPGIPKAINEFINNVANMIIGIFN